MDKENKYWRTPELKELLLDIRHEISQLTRPAHEIILDEADAMKYLKVSRRTLANWRLYNILKSRKIGGKIYYTLQDILDCLNDGEKSLSLPKARI